MSGCDAIAIDVRERTLRIGDAILREGDVITIDGTTGNVYPGQDPDGRGADSSPSSRRCCSWADEVARLEVMANADTPRDAARAREYGAKGIGLCRTERMFNDPQRLPIVQEMILADTPEERRAALAKLLPIQRADFKGIFAAMAGLPVTVRLLDPPMHEFLPTASQLEFEIGHLRNLRRAARSVAELPDTLKLLDPELPRDYVESLGKLQRSLAQYREAKRGDAALERREAMLKKVHQLSEVNPMLGHRGVRLGLTFPEIYEMQIRAILEAAAECSTEGIDVHPEIMVPQVCTAAELRARQGDGGRAAAGDRSAATACALDCKFGTMVEVVRACMRAADLAEIAEFFSFGTNDLTQATFSFSREDAENKFLPQYIESRRPAGQPVRDAGRRWRGTPDATRDRMGTRRAARPRRRHLRRARRAAGGNPVLPRRRARLRLVLGAPRAHRAPRGRAGGARRRAHQRRAPLRTDRRCPRVAAARIMVAFRERHSHEREIRQ